MLSTNSQKPKKGSFIHFSRPVREYMQNMFFQAERLEEEDY